MLGRDNEDEIWSKFLCKNCVIWHKKVTLVGNSRVRCAFGKCLGKVSFEDVDMLVEGDISQIPCLGHNQLCFVFRVWQTRNTIKYKEGRETRNNKEGLIKQSSRKNTCIFHSRLCSVPKKIKEKGPQPISEICTCRWFVSSGEIYGHKAKSSAPFIFLSNGEGRK